MNHDDDDYSQGFCQIIKKFRALPKDDILHPCMSDIEFRLSISSNEGNIPG